MPSLYSTLVVTEPGYGERIVRVHAGLHHGGVSHTEAVDLVTGERVLMPISTRWNQDTQRDVRVAADGWSWRPTSLPDAEKRAGLPRGSLPHHNDTKRTDLWADQRMRNPAFIALLTVLANHPEIVFYDVDWRDWVHARQPREQPHREDSPLLKEPKQQDCMGGRHVPYPVGGGGYMERYASHVSTLLSGASSPAVIKSQAPVDTLSDAVLGDLAHDYERIVQWQRSRDPFRRLHTGGAVDMPIVRSPTDIQVLVGWTPAVLAELDDVHAQAQQRLADETAPLRPQGVTLSLF